jgi:hypothetical protein
VIQDVAKNIKSKEAKDNVIAALCRIFFHHSESVPHEVLLPAIFNNIPLHGDIDENETILKCAFQLFNTRK